MAGAAERVQPADLAGGPLCGRAVEEGLRHPGFYEARAYPVDANVRACELLCGTGDEIYHAGLGQRRLPLTAAMQSGSVVLGLVRQAARGECYSVPNRWA